MTGREPVARELSAIVRRRIGSSPDAATVAVRPLDPGEDLVIGRRRDGSRQGSVPWPAGPIRDAMPSSAIRIAVAEARARVRVAPLRGVDVTVHGDGEDITALAIAPGGAIVGFEGPALVIDVVYGIAPGHTETVTVVLAGRDPD